MMSVERLVALAMISVLLGIFPASSTAQIKERVAVFDFDFNTADRGPVHYAYGDVKNLCRQVSDRLSVHLVNLGSYVVVERREVEKVIQEQDYGQTGRIDPDTAAKVGRMLGAKALIVGSITQLEFEGLPKNGSDPNWSPKQLRAKIVLSFRMIDSTTAWVRVAQEVVGYSATPADREYTKRDEVTERVIDSAVEGVLEKYRNRLPLRVPFERSTRVSEPTTEDFKRVINIAVEDATARMAQQLDQADSAVRIAANARDAPKTAINGRVLRVKATVIFVSGIKRSQIKLGDRLAVRRPLVERDPATGSVIRFSEKIGELEVTEIQEEVIVGTFSGGEIVKVGDIVTDK